MINGKIILSSFLFSLLIGCAGSVQERNVEAPPAMNPDAVVNYNGLKHRLAVSKFEDKTGYGSNLFGALDDLGSQASDILASHLIKTGEFVIVERENLASLEKENNLQGKSSKFAGVSALIFGAVTEFGTKTEWEDHGVSKTKVQTAHAKVTIRLVNPETGVAFYSEFGEANAKNETTQTLGFGGKATYDATLTDKALNGAITKLISNVLLNLRALPWKTAVLDIQDNQIIIGAGKGSGLKVGDVLEVQRPGKTVENPTTGAIMTLPGTTIAKIQVSSMFGKSIMEEGAVCSVISSSGAIQKYDDVIMEGQQ